jgi:hypothetical protein
MMGVCFECFFLYLHKEYRIYVKVSVKEGIREMGRERVSHEGRHTALAGDEDARPGGWWLGH